MANNLFLHKNKYAQILKNLKNDSILALASGDSYGSFYEVKGLYGERFFINSLPEIPKYPNITDDTKMAIILLKHYKKYKTLEVDILTKEYKVWAKIDGDKDGIGLHTRDVLVYNKQDKDSQGNGALMRNIPFGIELIKDGYSFDETVEMMNIDSAITHKNSTIFMANTLAFDLAINGLKVLEKDSYQALLSKLHYGYSAWVIHSLHIVIDALKRKRKFLTGFKYIASQGGDTDTNCAIYGAILGAKKDIKDELDIDSWI